MSLFFCFRDIENRPFNACTTDFEDITISTVA